MAEDRIAVALARIDAAARRIEMAAERANHLRAEARAALADLDQLLGTIQS